MLTEAQLLLLKTDIQADPMFVGWFAEEIAQEYNKPASPAWTVWRTSVTWDEIMLNGMDWARVDNLSVGKARIWDMPDPEPDPDLTAYANAPYEPPTDPAPRRRGRPPKARADDDSLRGGPAL